MIICKTDEEKNKLFKDIETQGFEWYTPLFLDSEEVWDGTDNPQVEDYCPSCRMLTDRHFNCTKPIDGWQWTLHHCVSCGAVWFEKDLL